MSQPFKWSPPAKRGDCRVQHPVSRALRAIGGVLPVIAERKTEQSRNYATSVALGAAFHAKIRAQWSESLHSENSEKN